MPPDLPNEQELNLKKRARRRLVGAIALVLLMVIVLPQILQDRVAQTQQEAIKITMPDTATDHQRFLEEKLNAVSQPNDIVAITEGDPALDGAEVGAGNEIAEPTLDQLIANKDADAKNTGLGIPEQTIAPEQVEKKEQKKSVEIKVAEVTKVESKLADKKEVKNEQPKLDERFTVQVGVYSDAANVKRLQEQLKQAGYMTSTEKVTTAKGESIRLKVGDFKTRQEAIGVLDKLKAIGFSGIVIATS